MSGFKGYVADIGLVAKNLPPLLPLTHSTLANGFEAILNDRCLTPAHCKFFKKKLVYLFYGRAAFRALPKKTDSKTHDTPALYPACILLDSRQLPAMDGQFPFDSGAYMSGRLGANLPEGSIEAFVMHDDILCLPRCVLAFYEDNEAFHDGRPRERLLKPSTCGAVSNYHDLLKSRTANAIDDRAKTPEVRVNQSIPLTRKTVLRLVAPKAWMEREFLWTAIEALDLKDKVSFYSSSLSTPEEHMSALRQKVADILVAMKLLPDDRALAARLYS